MPTPHAPGAWIQPHQNPPVHAVLPDGCLCRHHQLDPYLGRMEHISKSYGSVQALTDVTLTVGESEIVGLLGDNGAGKSTLIKILSGAIQLTSGDIYVRGRKVNIRTTTDAMAHGIETI